MAMKVNLSFAGCGFLGIYHVGVAVCFKKYAPHLLLHRISGASAGALAACCLLCDMPLGEMTSDFFRVVNEARSYSLGPFSPRFNIQTCLLEGLQKFLPPDAHERVNGKLHISLTRVYDGKNVIVSQFNSREDLLQALLCACFIPVFSGILPPRFHGVRYMDGAFSDNLPTLDENTVTVSPFCGESDICPRDNSSQMFHVNWANTSIELSKENINRFGRILFPPKPEILSSFCQQGFDDALNFLHRNNLISCTRCLSVQSTFVVAEQPQLLQDQLREEYDPECNECKECDAHRKDALDGSMPETVLTVFQTYIDQANKGLMNWIFKYRGAKILRALSLPATIPVDIFYATLTKIIAATPSIGKHLWALSRYAYRKVHAFLVRLRRYFQPEKPHQQNAEQTDAEGKEVALCDVRVDNGSDFRTMPSSLLPEGFDEQQDIHPDCDTFDHILQATSLHEAMYAYYYMDDQQKMRVWELFDLSDEASPAFQTAQERQLNQQLEFDNDWETTQPDFLSEHPDEADNIIDMEELIDPYLYAAVNLAQHLTSQIHHQQPNVHQQHQHHHLEHEHHHSLQYPSSCSPPSQAQIEEFSGDEAYLQPEVDQQQTLISEAAARLLAKPQQIASCTTLAADS